MNAVNNRPHPPTALVNARLIDPAAGTETRGGVLVVDGLIAEIGPRVTREAAQPGEHVIDCGGDIVCPGLIDMRVFIGEPGAEHRETFATASAAAAAGGVTTIVTTPGTTPPVDDPAVVDFILRRARDNSRVRVLAAAAMTKGLRGEDERMQLVEGLASGVIDVIVSDHNPQDVENKRLPFAEAEDGAIGLETMLSAAMRLVHAGHISLPKLIAAMTVRPAEILGLPQGRLAVGAPADLIRFDPDEPYVVDPAKLHSRSKNTPFDEARLDGRVKLTMVAGRIVHE